MLSILEKLQAGEINFNQAKALAQQACELSHSRTLDDYKIVRTYSAGVFAGFVKSKSEDSRRMVLTKARRLWYWSGAASLSQLAMEGVKNPGECKFPVAVAEVELTEVIEILDVTEAAKCSIDSVPVWSA
jgi:hypothetical protein